MSTTTDDDVPPTYRALYECSRGDRIRIHDDEYLVLDTTSGIRNLVSPSTPIVRDDDGQFRQLVMGALPRPHSDVGGVMWRSTATDTDTLEPSDLLARYDDVRVLDGDEGDALDALPRTTETECPVCGHDSVEWKDGWRDGTHVESLYVCLNSDDGCRARFVRGRTLDPSETATATVVDSDGDEHAIDLSGIYRETVTSKFKMDPTDNDDKEWYSATEVADFLKMKAGVDQSPDERHGHVEPDGVRFKRGHRTDPTWRDDVYDTKMLVTFHPADE